MAKYTIKNRVSGDRRVNCRVLNECAGDYVVQFDDKSIKRVPADRVDSLNRIDEGVLDRVREFGEKIMSGLKKIGKSIKAYICGAPVSAGVPANGYTEVADIQGAAFHGDSASQSIASANGVPSTDVDNIDENYDDGMGEAVARHIYLIFNDFANFITNVYTKKDESSRSPYRRVNAVSETMNVFQDPHLQPLNFIGDETAVNTYLKYSEDEIKDKDNIKSYSTTRIDTFGLKSILSNLISEFVKNGTPEGTKSYPCIWGAGGIGKTDIIVSTFNSFKRKYPNMNFFYINLATTQKYDITLPEVEKADDGTLKNVTAYKTWLPIYKRAKIYTDIPKVVRMNIYDKLIEEGVITQAESLENYNMMNDEIANGGDAGIDPETGRVNVSIKGNGGLIFFDEISRSDPKVLNILMTILSERMVDEGTIGSKWVFVFAGNMLKDLVSAAKMRSTGTGNIKDIQFLIDGPVADRLTPYEFIPDVNSWVSYIKKRYNIPEEICEFFLQYPKMYLHSTDTFVKDGKNLIVDTFKDIDRNANNGIKIGNPRNWVDALMSLARHISGYDKFIDDEATLKDIFDRANITYEEYDDEFPANDTPEENERVRRGIEIVNDELKKNGNGLEPADVLKYYHMMNSMNAHGGMDPEHKKYEDFGDIPLNDIADIIYNKVGAVGTVNFVNYMKQLREFSLTTVRGLIDAHPTLNGKVDTSRNFIDRSDIKGVKYDGFLSKRIARLISTALCEKGFEKGSKLTDMDEYYNIIRYFIIVGRSLGFENKPLLKNLYEDTMIAIGKQSKNTIELPEEYVDEEAIITIINLSQDKKITDEALYTKKSVIESAMKGVEEIAKANIKAAAEKRMNRK